MSPEPDPYGIYDADRPLRLGCRCGAHASRAGHAAAELRTRSESADVEASSRGGTAAALVKALFPQDAVRRRFLRAVGRNAAMAAIGSVLPIASLQALAINLGQGATGTPMNVATIQNTNGQAITLSVKHKDKRDPKTWKGFKFAVPFEYSRHNVLLRYYVAEAGLNPDTDIQIRVVPPPEMVANLLEPARDGGGTGAHRQVRRRAGQREGRARPRRLRPHALAEHGSSGPTWPPRWA